LTKASNPLKRAYRSPKPNFASISLSDGNNYVFYYDSDESIACISGKDAVIFSNTTVQPSPGVTIQAGVTCPLAATAWENDSGKLQEVSC